MAEEQVRTSRSFCRICTSLCGILVDAVGEQVVHVRGDREHPLSEGYTCAKGRALPELHHHPDRLERPLLRVDGSLQPTSWESCLDDLADRLRETIERHGPGSVGIFFGSGLGMDAAGYRMAEALHAAIGTPARFSPLTIDGTAKVLAATLVGGFPGLNPRPDYDHAALVIYLGINPVVSHGHTTAMPSPTTTLRSLQERADVWVLDPRRTETAGLASHHIAPRPGTDYAILAHVVRELLHDGSGKDVLTVDRDALWAAVDPFVVEHAAEIADVPADELTALVAAVRRAGRVAIETGTGITMSADANVVQWLAWVVMILTDSINRPGGVWFHPGFFRLLDAAPVPILPSEVFFNAGPPSRPELPGFLGEWPCAALPSEIETGNIRALLNLGGGLLTAFPEESVMRRSLEQLEVLATIEIIGNSSTELSTHVLPTKDQLERSDINLWDFLSPRVVGLYSPAVVRPVGERRSSWWVLAELGRRLGHALGVDLPAADDPLSDDAMLGLQTSAARCSFDELAERRYVEQPHELPAPWVEDYLRELGGWRLAPPQLVAQLASMQRPPRLCLVPRRQKRHVNSQLSFLGDTADVLLNPDDAAAAEVTDGMQVIVRSATGELVGTARVDHGMRAGAVSVPHGHAVANVNLLTSHREADPLTGMARYSGVPVSLHPA